MCVRACVCSCVCVCVRVRVHAHTYVHVYVCVCVPVTLCVFKQWKHPFWYIMDAVICSDVPIRHFVDYLISLTFDSSNLPILVTDPMFKFHHVSWSIVVYLLQLSFDFINKSQIIKVALVNDLYKSANKN